MCVRMRAYFLSRISRGFLRLCCQWLGGHVGKYLATSTPGEDLASGCGTQGRLSTEGCTELSCLFFVKLERKRRCKPNLQWSLDAKMCLLSQQNSLNFQLVRRQGHVSFLSEISALVWFVGSSPVCELQYAQSPS